MKARVQQKIECYEVEWQNVSLGETCSPTFVTIETREVYKMTIYLFIYLFICRMVVVVKHRGFKGDMNWRSPLYE